MSVRRFSLVSFMRQQLPVTDAHLLLRVLIRGTAQEVRDGCLSVKDANRIVFNLDVLEFCSDVVQHADIQWAIEYGMELGNIERLVSDPGAVSEACSRIDSRLRHDQ